jgi:hypothetical protein
VKKDTLIGGFAATYGKEKAREVLDTLLLEARLPLKEDYTREEILQLSAHMESSSNRFIRIIGKFIMVKVDFADE